MRVIQKICLVLVILGGITPKAQACFEGYTTDTFSHRYNPGLSNPLFEKNLNLTQQQLLNSEVFKLYEHRPESINVGQYHLISLFSEIGSYKADFAMYSLENGTVNGYVLMELLIPRDPCIYEDLKQSYLKDLVEVPQNFSQTLPSGFSLSLFEKRNKRFIFQTLLLNTPIAPYNKSPHRASSFVLVRAKYPIELEAFIQPRIQAYLTANLDEFVLGLNQISEPDPE